MSMSFFPQQPPTWTALSKIGRYFTSIWHRQRRCIVTLAHKSKNRGADKGNLGGANANLPTKKISLKPNLPIKKTSLALQIRLAIMLYCKFTDKLNIYCKFADKPNFWGMRHPHIPLWLRPCLKMLATPCARIKNWTPVSTSKFTVVPPAAPK